MPLADAISYAATRADEYRSHSASAVKASSRGRRRGSGNSLAAGGNPYVTANGMGGLLSQQNQSSRDAEYLRYNRDWVYTAIRPIAHRIAAQPVRAGFRRRGDQAPGRMLKGLDLQMHISRFAGAPIQVKALAESIEPVHDHPFLDVIEDPNDLMVQWQMMVFTITNLMLCGRAFWWLDEATTPGRLKIWPLPSSWVTPGKAESGQLLGKWQVQPIGAAKPSLVDPRDMCYFSLPDPADPMGCLSPIKAQAKAVTVDEYLQTAQVKHYQSIRPNMILKAGRLPDMNNPSLDGRRPFMEPHQRKQLIEMMRAVYKGVQNWDEPLIIDGMIDDVHILDRSASEMGYIESGAASKARVMQGIGTNPIVCGEIEGANRASAWAADQNFVDNACNPIITLISQVMTKQIGGRYANQPTSQSGLPQGASTGKLHLWIEDAKARDEEMQLQKDKLGVSAGVITKNELRERLGLPPLKGPEGEELIMIGPMAPDPSAEGQGQGGKPGSAAARGSGQPKPARPRPSSGQGKPGAAGKRRAG